MVAEEEEEMSKKKAVQIKCSCGEEFTLPAKMKGSFECVCGERYGVNERPEVVVAPYRPYVPYVQPWRPYNGPWYGGTRITSISPNINSGGGFSNVVSAAKPSAITTTSDSYLSKFKLN